ncbi:hypothetical protein BDV23DRAFT_180574 [Aspergillus alliaceus]|uniref:Uncharacterized protein n=1 Tax=Petromyces alliaceus TaxID=209559 RepID=A0A5N7CIE0_PETAA|nr:hypothetical protein BDV23DRAFT_180574 [Aspergillus alliaceus]
MLTYYCPRLESTYVPNLKSNLKECCRIFHGDKDDNFVPACRHLRARPQLIFSKDLPGRALSFKYCRCYKSLRGTPDEASPRTAPMFTTQHNSSQGTMGGYLLPQQAVCRFRDIHRCLKPSPSFRKVTIIPIPRDIVTQRALQNPLSLERAFTALAYL